MTSDLHPADLELAELLVTANRVIVDQEVVDGFGHISARCASDPTRFLLARNRPPSLVTRDDIQVIDLDGNTLDERPSYLERYIHAEVYRARPDVQAVVHSHSGAVVSFSVGGVPLRAVSHMASFLTHPVPRFEIREARGEHNDMLISDSDSGAALARVLGDAPLVLMRGHGATIVGDSILEAVYRAVYTERNAQAQLAALQLGAEPIYLSDAEVETSSAGWVKAQGSRAWLHWAARVVADAGAPGYEVGAFYVAGAWDGMYVERWTPHGAIRGRVVCIHGGGETGAFFATAPGEETGWVQRLTRAGWESYLIDWPGTGRSGDSRDLHTKGPQPIIEALRALLQRIGPSTLIGHSIGGTIALKLADIDESLVRGIVLVNAGPTGNIHTEPPPMDESRTVYTPRERLVATFTTAARFPQEHYDEFAASRVPLSPRVYNALGGRRGDEFVLRDLDAVRRVPKLIVTALGDQVVPESEWSAQHELVGGDLVVLDRDWNLPGFGHLIPVERGSHEVIDRIDAWLRTHVA